MDLDSTALLLFAFLAIGSILCASFCLKILLECLCALEICIGLSQRGRRRVGRIQVEHQGQIRWGKGGQKGGESDGIPYIEKEVRLEGEDGSDLEGRHNGEKACRAAESFSLHYTPQRALPPLIHPSNLTPTLRRFPSLFIFT